MNDAITQAVDDEMPFFAYMSHYAVHSPFQGDARFSANYKDAGSERHANLSLIHI